MYVQILEGTGTTVKLICVFSVGLLVKESYTKSTTINSPLKSPTEAHIRGHWTESET